MFTRRSLGILFLGAGWLASGCAANLATLVDAETVAPKKVHVNFGYGVFLPLGPVAKLAEAGLTEAKRLGDLAKTGQNPPLGDAEKRTLLDAGVAIALMPPSTGWEVQARTGIIDNLDIGLRYSVNQVRGDVRYRLYHSELWEPPEAQPAATAGETGLKEKVASALAPDKRLRSYDATVQLGVSRYLFKNIIFELLDFVKLGDFSRWDFDLTLTWGLDIRRIFKFYGGPKVIYTRFKMDENLYEISKFAGDQGLPILTESIDHDMWFFGAVAGIAAGYKWVFVFLELTGGYTYSRPVVLGEERDIGGPTLYPTIAIAAKFP